MQRRHQKVLEEAPSHRRSTPSSAAELSDAAVRFARAIGYVGAGHRRVRARRPRVLLPRAERTHPGRASGDGGRDRHRPRRTGSSGSRDGERLDARSRSCAAHAVEVRLYAEDPRTFLPQAGPIERLRLPASIRVDAGVAEGDEIGDRLRPADREADRGRRRRATRRSTGSPAPSPRRRSRGVTTNLPFLRWLVAHPALRAGETTTAFLVEYPPLSPPPAAAAGAGLARRRSGSTCPSPPPRPPPDLDAAARGTRTRRRARRPSTRADARHRAPRARRRERATSWPRRAARRARGDEDGDAARLAVRRGRRAVHVREGDRVAGGATARRAGAELDGLEQLLQLQGCAHVAFDLELPGHVGGGRILLAGDDLARRLARGRDRRVGAPSPRPR